MMEDHLNAMRREAERVFARSTTWSVGTIDSYDKATHSAKVKLQPEGTLSGWLPLNSVGVGNGYGVHVGPKAGDPVLVHFHEGDREAGVILGRFFTDKHPPVPVEEGEVLVQHETNTKAFFKKDGSLLIQFKSSNTEILFGADKSLLVKQDGGAQIMFAADGSIAVSQGNGAAVKFTTDGQVSAQPAPEKMLFLGGDGVTGAYDFVSTMSGPSTNTKARTA